MVRDEKLMTGVVVASKYFKLGFDQPLDLTSILLVRRYQVPGTGSGNAFWGY